MYVEVYRTSHAAQTVSRQREKVLGSVYDLTTANHIQRPSCLIQMMLTSQITISQNECVSSTHCQKGFTVGTRCPLAIQGITVASGMASGSVRFAQMA